MQHEAFPESAALSVIVDSHMQSLSNVSWKDALITQGRSKR
jgi:hypothetical protein